VLGRVNEWSEILARVGVYGNYWDIPANLIFELPGEIRDVCDGKGELEYEETNNEQQSSIEVFDGTACAK
ncbi:hypothetical protein Q8G50_32205, partial [Klebsiella pneumoniae]